MIRTPRTFPAVILSALLVTTAAAQPDVIVGDVTGPCNYTAQSGYDAFSLGTTSCNLGTAPLIWQATTNEHPVMGGTLYRYDPTNRGRFTMIGMSWVKHGFGALQQDICGGCQPYPNNTALGINCSDPYGACQNGQQSGLGPRSDINPSTGYFSYPPSNPSWSGNTARRLRVPLGDLDTASTYVCEAQYIHWQDALGGVDDNNASYRLAQVTGGPTNYDLTFTAPTVRQLPAIAAWAAIDAGVVLQSVQAMGPDGGLFNLGAKRTDNGDGTWHFEYCVQNLNCHDGGAGFSVQFAPAVVITNTGFHAPQTHSNEVYNNNPWGVSTASNGVTWSVDQPFSQNANANAMRWSEGYSFWFDATDPAPLSATVDLFRSGGAVTLPAPQFPGPSWQVNGVAHLDVDGNAANDPYLGPIQVDVSSGTSHVAHLDGVTGQPFELYLSAVPAIPAAYVSADGDIVNLDLVSAPLIQLFGNNPLMPAGGQNLPFTIPGSVFYAGQLFTANPISLEGFSLSACTELTVSPQPRVVVSCDGSNSYVTDPDGFWNITHNGTTPAAIVGVVLSFQGAASPANGVYFDTDQGMPAAGGVFSQGSTYRNNSDVATGLDYSASNPFTNSGWSGSNNIGGANYNTVTFQFTGSQFHGNALQFDADTDPGTVGAADHVGMNVTVLLDDGSILTGALSLDPNNGNRSVVELW